ncbi:phosphoenolpyruvate synthase [Clostridium sp. 'White wine YQ']|uniref:phosphoenolpyruvate synthase n=1 Tax=Clostridium sp. 'White wine YQ' TaxID=3027474 RepID=UPI002366DBCC|nr:phosphoenolpyruvate synthase [Clostridium sp. 'White wine YQ']MDD7794100.1 phosphoenolpyruvate synthase [Clostridium sp. 'White wine YQ']
MNKYVLKFNEIDKSSLPYVGGKGANLGEMTKAGFPVPQGFCVTTLAYKNFIETSKEMRKLFDLLDTLEYTQLEKISELGKVIRNHIQTIIMPQNIKSSILEAFKLSGENKAYAVRSSATAEDLPTASFAGQQDTYLNICGECELLKAIQNCWASLFTDRAISYRAKNGFDHRLVFLSVVVQEMVFPEVSGIMFTADPISGRRKTLSIDASYGLGEALVSGIVSADLYQVRDSKIINKQISKKKIAIYSIPEGGTVTKDVPNEKQEMQALSDKEILSLASLGQEIEAHYGIEQDIEWGLSEGKFYILQSRPITSLYPLPKVSDDNYHVFVSFGHIQMMTDTMKPLAISIFKNLTNFLKNDSSDIGNSFIVDAGGRMFADFTTPLSLKPTQKRLFKILRGMDEQISSALFEAINREDFIKVKVSKKDILHVVKKMFPIIKHVSSRVIANLYIKDSSYAKDEANALIEKILMESKKDILSATGSKRIEKIQENIGQMLPNVLAEVVPYWVSGMFATSSLEKKLINKVGEKNCAYLISKLNKSLPGNVTTEIGLRVADLADIARNYPELVDYLEKAQKETFFEGLSKISGGNEFKAEFEKFLKKYGMRCSSEIDITKPRWHEDPTQLIPAILSNVRTASGGEHVEKYKEGEFEAENATKEILSHFNSFERRKISKLIKLYRNLMGMREHHKFAVITHIDLYKCVIMEEAHSLAQKGVLKNEKDIYYFSLSEIIELLENRFSKNIENHIDSIIKNYEQFENLTPPRVMTSYGEIITGKRKNINAPNGALTGIPVSAGIIEGTARVILKLEDAKLNPGEILVAPFTDPGWTPLFTSAIGLITEVGGMMTHGSVIAREYGIPAVVGIDKVTELIKDGDYIRVNGTEGYVEFVDKKSS